MRVNARSTRTTATSSCSSPCTATIWGSPQWWPDQHRKAAMDSDNTLLVLSNRNYLYGLLARVFASEPDETLLQIVALDHTRLELGLIADELTESILVAYEAVLEASAGADLSRLRAEYTTIFIGPGTCKAYPWESVHLSDTKALFQPELLPTREAYRAAGFLPARYPHVQDDFIGLELDFLAKLADAALQACELGDTAAMTERLEQSRSFLHEHLLRWIDSLASSIEREYGNGFYARFARLAALIARRDCVLLAELLSD